MNKIKQLYKRLRSITIYRPGIRKVLIVSLIVILLIITLPAAFLFSVRFGFFGDIANKEQLQNINNSTATEIYSADSVLLGKYYYQNRTNTKHGNISPDLINGLIATEDARFYQHEGIDLRSWVRVLIKTILMNEDAGGGSTISQQLAKNLYGRQNNEWLVITKIKEAIIAQRLEDIYTKDEIITLYFNTVPFGEDVYGIETASQRFFNKSARNLSLQEAATLVGMLKANHYYNPRYFPYRSKARRNVVLNQMAAYGYIDRDVADSVKTLPMETDIQMITTNTGLATYFREFLRQEMEEWARSHTKSDGSTYNIYSDGLKVFTTIDSKLQKYAEEAVNERMKELQKEFEEHWKTKKPWDRDKNILTTAVERTKLYKELKAKGESDEEIKKVFAEEKMTSYFSYDGEGAKKMSKLDSLKHHIMFLHAGLLAIDPVKGYIKTWVGGIDHKYFKYDHVNVKTKRQVGSTFKPIVYTAALQSGVDPCSYIDAAQVTYRDEDKTWTPRNSNGEYEKKFSMAGALMNSINTVSVKLLTQAGIDHTISLAKAMGIQSEIPEYPSIALGTMEASLYEMVQAYCTFANDGAPIKPIYIQRITDQNGQVIEEFHPDTTKDNVIDEDQNEMMLEMMKDVVNRGTASKLRWKYKIKNDIAGKTGTTQNNADGWFIALTPRLVTGVWVGADDPRIRFRYTSLGQGSSTALPVFASFFEKINNDSTLNFISEAKFEPPSNEVRARLNCEPFIEETPSLFELLFGKKEDKEDKEKVKKKKKKEEDLNFFERLFKRKENDN